ncbi:MAG: respiratory nitrate reductase subunit gamma [Nitrococcus sp.]|nr:respiratory nitrate reductase subunit gamma [Nitrococcus sp.]
MSDVILVGLPYIAVALAILVGVYRFKTDTFSHSSFSSQLLENQKLFWGSALWHYAIVLILLAHFIAFLIPPLWGVIYGGATVAFEAFGLILSLVGFLALGWLMMRRFSSRRVFVVTSRMDWVVVSLLLLQMALGFLVALSYRWGGQWFVSSTAPWLWSLATLNPQADYVSAMPFLVQLHFLVGFLLIALYPFSRLVHLVFFPIHYLWRPYQRVIWNRAPRPGLGAARSVPEDIRLRRLSS